MEQEIWKTIPNYEDYQVSNLGNVKSLKYGKERILKPFLRKTGYLLVMLSLNGKQRCFKVHKLVVMAFLNQFPCGMKKVVNHINFIRNDNRLCNLEIISQRENANKKHIKSTSRYVGVYWYKAKKKWIASIRINGKLKHLGCFKKEEDASNAYQKELKLIHKNSC